MRGTFGLGRIFKKGLAKDQKNEKNYKQKTNYLNIPEILELQKEKDKLDDEENKINEEIDVIDNKNLKLKNEINDFETSKRQIKISALINDQKDLRSELKDELNKEENTKNDKNINKIKNKIENLQKQIRINSKQKEKLISNIVDSKESIEINNSKVEILNEKIKAIKLKIATVEKKISDEIEIQDIKNSKIRRRKVILSLLIPIGFFGMYFYGIGRNRFQVSSDVVVRKSGSSTQTGSSISTLLGLGNQGSLEDARFLKIYLESPQLLDELNNVFDFRRRYEKRNPDIFSGLKKNATKDDTYDFFKKQIQIILDEVSGSINIVTFAFDSKTSLEFNNFLIAKSEEFVNKLNQNIYLRQIDFVEDQVDKNRQRLSSDLDNLKKFQRNNLSLNLNQELVASSGLISSLENKLIDLKLDLAVLKRQFIDQAAPEILYQESRIDELKKQIKEERNLLVSPSGKNIGEKASNLSRLEANYQFSNDLYKSSLTASEKTKLDSQQQQRFMAKLSEPFLPENQWYYWRHKGFLTSVGVLLVSYFLLKFFMGIADSHNY